MFSTIHAIIFLAAFLDIGSAHSGRPFMSAPAPRKSNRRRRRRGLFQNIREPDEEISNETMTSETLSVVAYMLNLGCVTFLPPSKGNALHMCLRKL
ncbi:hypothetical protein F5Y13DRAFT_161539 [Hypoxylon sp. FL1857]|nr:hypothetical protein F5Y13DRAFT_161539 [Hypoxylon sp. FL1857]